MKTWAKWLIAGGVILTVGIIILIIGLAANGWKWRTTEDFVQKEFVAQDSISAYDIRIAASKVKVEFTDEDAASVSYPESERFGYEVTEENGKLTVAYNKGYIFFFGWFAPSNTPETVIKVPKANKADFNLQIDAGTLVLAEGSFGKIDVKLNAGKFEMGAISCANLDFHVSAGEAVLSSVECSTLNVDVSAGSFRLNKAVCDKLIVEVSAGSANVKGVSCPDIYADVSAGSANLAVNGVRAEYNITVDKSAGSCNLGPQTGSDPSKRVRVDVSAGSANITFDN